MEESKYLQKVREQLSSLFRYIKTAEEVEQLSKEEVIRDICEYHPGYGIEIGWSWYVGGMADTGAWIPEKMKLFHIKDLKEWLIKTNAEEKIHNAKAIIEWTEVYRMEDLPEPERTELKNKRWQDAQAKEHKAMKEIIEKTEHFLMWGKG